MFQEWKKKFYKTSAGLILAFLSEILPSWEQNLIIPRNRWIGYIWHSVMSLIMKNGSQNLSLMTGRCRQYNRHTLTANNTVALFPNSSCCISRQHTWGAFPIDFTKSAYIWKNIDPICCWSAEQLLAIKTPI